MGIALAVSIVANICLIRMYSEVKGELKDVGNQFVIVQDQITNLQGQSADFVELQAQESELQGQLANYEELQTEVTDLQRQLTESKDLIESLDSTITEQNITVTSLEEQRSNQEQLLLAAQDNSHHATPNDTPTDHTYDTQHGNNGIPELSGDPSTWPCTPGYEYKPGTEYVYPIGWIPSKGGTGAIATDPGSTNPYTECVYDANGNCTVHQHSGY